MSSEWPRASLESLVNPNRPITYGVVKPGREAPDGVMLQEGHNALERYARWEKPGKRKYAGVQRTTRLHMARYRKALAALEAESKVASPQSTAP